MRRSQRSIVTVLSGFHLPTSGSTLRPEEEADLNISEPRHATPDDHVSRRPITSSCKVAAELRKSCQALIQRWCTVRFRWRVAESAEQIDLQRCEREGWRRLPHRAVQHRQPKNAPTEKTGRRQEID